MSDRGDHMPEGAPPTPAGGTPGGSDPNTRVAPGHENETGWQAGGRIIDRLRSSKSGGSAAPGDEPATGQGGASDEDTSRGPITDSGFRQTDSSIGVRKSGTAGTSTVGGRGVGDDLAFQQPRPEDIDRRRERRAELVVAFFFMLSVAGTLVFVVANFIGDPHKQYYTPLLGVSLAVALSGVGIGVVHWAKRLMPDEEAVQEREPHFSKPEEFEATEETFARGFNELGVARRPLLRRTLLAAGGALGLIGIVPLLNFGTKPGRHPKALESTKWAKGTRMITQDGTPVKLGDLSAGAILTVFPGLEKKPEGDSYEEPEIETKGDSTVILIRMRPGELTTAPGRESWVYDGHIAFSKICTHAGCPVSLYEQQTHHLLCPCHQSVFDVTAGGRPIFGPAARSLPQLPITVDEEGYFVAQSDFTQPVGPSFWERT